MGKATKALHLARAMKARSTGISLDPNLTISTAEGRNLIINGAMNISQRGTIDTGITGGTLVETYRAAPDRHRFALNTGGTWTASQDSDAPDGFSRSYKLECTTANASLSASSYALIEHRFEGRQLLGVKKGTANAKSLTLSFWVKSSVSGNYMSELYDHTNQRQCSKLYTINSADTWEYKKIIFPPDTSGTLNDDTNNSISVDMWFLAGTDFNSGTLPSGWASVNGPDRANGHNVNLAATQGNTIRLTGFQLEIGSDVTPFEHVKYEDELYRCKRYYQRYNRFSNYAGLGLFVPFTTSGANCLFYMDVEPRGNPTIQYSSLSHFDYFGVTGSGGSGNPSAIQNNGWAGANSIDLGFVAASSHLTIARAGLFEFNNSADAWLAFHSEL
tara:strand:- start:22271 stop:23434 length:1164 start_codon:yes stop_codon:yes gene_type:complete